MACSIFVLYYRANARKGSTWNLRNTFYPYFNTILSKWESKIRKSHKYSLSKQKLSAITTKTSVKWQRNTPCRATVISKHLTLKGKATPRPSSIYVLLSLQVQKSQNSKTKHVTYCCQGRDSLPRDLNGSQRWLLAPWLFTIGPPRPSRGRRDVCDDCSFWRFTQMWRSRQSQVFGRVKQWHLAIFIYFGFSKF